VLAAVKHAARRLRPCLTAAARGARGRSGWGEETALVSRSKKHPWLQTNRNERGPFWVPIGGPVPVPIDKLRQANEILRKASAYFAMAELDRRSKP
jgi:hypothetical protein